MSDNTLGRLIVIIGGDGRDLDNALKQSNSNILKFAKGVSNVADELFNLRNAFVVAGAAAVTAFVKQGALAGDEIDKTAKKIGITTDSLQELRYAAINVGITTEDFDNALLHLSKNLGDTSGDVTPFVVALGKLGLTMADMKGKLPDQALGMLADRIKNIADPTQRAAIEVGLFNKAGQQMNNLLALGSSGLAGVAAEAHKLGLILGAETIKKATEANDEFTKIGAALKVAGVNIAIGFLPALEDVRKTVTSPDFQAGVKTLASDFASLVSSMVDHKAGVVEFASIMAGMKIGGAFGGAFGGAGSAIGTVVGGVAGLVVSAREARPELEKLNSAIQGCEEQIAALGRMTNKTQNDDLIQQYTLDVDKLKIKLAGLQAQRNDLIKSMSSQGFDEAGFLPLAPPSTSVTVGPPIDAATKAAIEELSFKTRILNQDFAALAPGFAEAAKGLKQFGVEAHPAVTSVGELSPQLQSLNKGLLDFKAAQITQDNLTPWQLYTQQLTALDIVQKNSTLSAETYQAALLKIKFPSLAAGIKDAQDLNKNIDQLSTSMVNNFASGFAQVITGQKKAGEAFKAFGQTVLTTLIEMIVKMLIFKAIELAIGFAGGGPVAEGQNMGAGLSASAENPSMFAGGGQVGGGGLVSGPGSTTSDSILARLSDKEYVVNAASTQRFLPLLEAINSGSLPGMAAGGQMIASNDMGGSSYGGGDAGGNVVHVHFGENAPSKDEVRRFLKVMEQVSADGRPIKIKIAK